MYAIRSYYVLTDHMMQFFSFTGFANFTVGHLIMILIGLAFIYLAIAKEFEPMLLIPIGFGILVGNIPFASGYQIGIYENGSVLNYLYFGVTQGVYPVITSYSIHYTKLYDLIPIAVIQFFKFAFR